MSAARTTWAMRARIREQLARLIPLSAQLPLPRDVPLRSPAGYSLPCRLHLPAGPGPHPGVLMLPGALDGPAALEARSCVLTAPRLARHGFAVLVFAPSGRDGAPGKEDFNGLLHQDEAAGALRALLSHPLVDPARVGVLSISYGVVMGMGALTRHPDLAAQVRVFQDWEGPPSRAWFVPARLAEEAGVDPREDEDFCAHREAARMAPLLRCPYRRIQSRWDHVHGPQLEIGLEIAAAAVEGACPSVKINGTSCYAGIQADAIEWAPARQHRQAHQMLMWMRQDLSATLLDP